MYLIRPILWATGLWSVSAKAHSPLSHDVSDAITSGLTIAMVVVLCYLYQRGARLAAPRVWQYWLYYGAMLMTLATLVGPLDTWAETSSAAHMLQHMIMIVVIAPIIAICRPFPQLYRAAGGIKMFWHYAFILTRFPLGCAYLHAAVIWFWHIPNYYQLALVNPWLHIVEHVCFLLTGLWFWWACLHARIGKVPYALLALLLTLMHTGFLGALLTFAQNPLYGDSRKLADQQLAGLLMWVLGGIPYIVAGFWITLRWYRQLRRTVLPD